LDNFKNPPTRIYCGTTGLFRWIHSTPSFLENPNKQQQWRKMWINRKLWKHQILNNGKPMEKKPNRVKTSAKNVTATSSIIENTRVNGMLRRSKWRNEKIQYC